MNSQRKSEYAKKFLDPRWQKKRLAILTRDHWACQICGDDTSTLHVHHRYYIQGCEPWDYDDLVLVTLCANCHESEPPVTQCDFPKVIAFQLGWFSFEIDELAHALIDSICEAAHPALSSAYAHAIRRLDPDKVLQDYLEMLASAHEDDTTCGEGVQ